MLRALSDWHQHRKQADTDWKNWTYMVLDMETTGLDPKQHQVVSLGWVLVENGAILLDSAQHIVLQGAEIDPETVAIHMITDQDVEELGRNQASVLRYLRQLIKGKVLVAHHAPIELGFLKRLWGTQPMPDLSVQWLDTLALERTKAERKGAIIQEGGFRLGACRERYGLPDYNGHDALTDALATAELLLAQIAHQPTSPTLMELTKAGGGLTRLQSKST
ncbi:3'-5' exonuclease [Maribrevibacterium harenarium]|nr:3'-5' exonuclease [Maribrevibacterium harenarium]